MIRIFKRCKEDEKVRVLESVEKNCWIDLENPTGGELKYIEGSLKLPLDFLDSCTDPEESPRIEKEKGAALIILRVPIIKEGEVETTTLGIIIKDEYFVTVHLEKLDFLERFIDKGKFYTDKRTRLLLQILHSAIQEFISFLKKLEKATEETERELFTSIEAEDIIKVWRIRQAFVYLNDAVIGNDKVLESILKGKVVRLFKGDQEVIEDLVIENRQLMRTIGVFTNLIASTMDAYASLISNNLNVVMKRLTSLALILSIPVTIASIYGMNIRLPLQTNPNALLILLLISFLISFALLVVFRRKKWI